MVPLELRHDLRPVDDGTDTERHFSQRPRDDFADEVVVCPTSVLGAGKQTYPQRQEY